MASTTWYHVTRDENVESILSTGLRASKSGLDGSGVYLFRGPITEAVKEAALSLADNHYQLSDAEFLDYIRDLSVLAVDLPADATFTVEYPEYAVYAHNIPAESVTACGCLADLVEHGDKTAILFKDVFPGAVSEAVDSYFKEKGWELQIWQTTSGLGYQVFFGAGVQVDNLYEYGLSYLYDKDELLCFMQNFYALHCLNANIDESKITDSARISACWDSFGITVDLNYSYDEKEGYGDGVLCFCETYADDTPNQTAWAEALGIALCLKEKYGLPVDIGQDVDLLKKTGINPLEVLDAFESNNAAFYTVVVQPGYCVDVKLCVDTGLAYVIQNDDGSLVYEAGNADHTYPDYAVNEQAIIQFVKAVHAKSVSAHKPDLSTRILSAATRVAAPGSLVPSQANDHTVER